MKNQILLASENGHYLLRLIGDIRLNRCVELSKCLQLDNKIAIKTLIVDLSETIWLDSTILGFLTRLAQLFIDQNNNKPMIITNNQDIVDLLRSMYMHKVFDISFDGETCIKDLVAKYSKYLKSVNIDESSPNVEALQQEVLKSHQSLMKLNKSNKDKFSDLLKILEA